MQNKRYLGDGCYAEFESGMIKLSAPRDNHEHYVYLESDVLREFVRYFNDISTAYTLELKEKKT